MKKIIILSTIILSTTVFAGNSCSKYIDLADKNIINAEKTESINYKIGYSNMATMYMNRYKLCQRQLMMSGKMRMGASKSVTINSANNISESNQKWDKNYIKISNSK